MNLKGNKDVIAEWVQLAQTQPLDKLPEVLQQVVSYGQFMSVVYLIATFILLLGCIAVFSGVDKEDSVVFVVGILPVAATAFALEHFVYVWLAPHIYLIEQLTSAH